MAAVVASGIVRSGARPPVAIRAGRAPGEARGRAPKVRVAFPVRLTRRGRLVLLGLLLVLATLVTGLVAAPGEASSRPGTPATAVVQPGDTLWSIARRYAPARDPFETIDDIRRLNGIADYTVQPGQRLTLPGGRAG